jgi:heme-degrading monooxygenase HmoA
MYIIESSSYRNVSRNDWKTQERYTDTWQKFDCLICKAATDEKRRLQSNQKGRTPMYARVTTFQLQPGKIDAWLHIAHESVIPVVRQQRGYKNGLVLTDTNANKIVVITLWETETDMKAGETSGYYREQLAQVVPLLAAVPVPEAYEVSLQV